MRVARYRKRSNVKRRMASSKGRKIEKRGTEHLHMSTFLPLFLCIYIQNVFPVLAFFIVPLFAFANIANFSYIDLAKEANAKRVFPGS